MPDTCVGESRFASVLAKAAGWGGVPVVRPRRPPATAFLLVPGTRRLSLPVLVGEGAAPPRDCVSLGAGEARVRCILFYLIVFNIRFLVLELSRPRHLAFASGVDTMGRLCMLRDGRRAVCTPVAWGQTFLCS